MQWIKLSTTCQDQIKTIQQVVPKGCMHKHLGTTNLAESKPNTGSPLMCVQGVCGTHACGTNAPHCTHANALTNMHHNNSIMMFE